MQIKVNQIESEPNKIQIFFDAFKMGQDAARKAWGK